MNKIYEEYAQLVQQEKEIKLLKEKMIGAIMKDMIARNVSSEDHTFGKYTVTYLKKWEYPSKVVELEDKAKAAKSKAQSTGEATYTEEPSLRFTLKELF